MSVFKHSIHIKRCCLFVQGSTVFSLFRFFPPFGACPQFQSQGLKKFCQKGAAFFLTDTFFHLGVVIKIHGKQIAHRAAGTAFLIRSAKHHPGDPGIDNGSRAHRTRLQCHVQRTLPQAPASQCLTGLPDRLHLGMSQRRLPRLPTVAPTAYNFTVTYNNAANGHLALSGSLPCQIQGHIHKLQIRHPITSLQLLYQQ